jgi:hypothetical protein
VNTARVVTAEQTDPFAENDMASMTVAVLAGSLAQGHEDPAALAADENATLATTGLDARGLLLLSLASVALGAWLMAAGATRIRRAAPLRTRF